MLDNIPLVTRENLDGAVLSMKKDDIVPLLEKFKEEQPFIYQDLIETYDNVHDTSIAVATALTTYYIIKRQLEINELNETNN